MDAANRGCRMRRGDIGNIGESWVGMTRDGGQTSACMTLNVLIPVEALVYRVGGMRSLIGRDAGMSVGRMIGDALTLVGSDGWQLAGVVYTRVTTRARDASSTVTLSSEGLVWGHVGVTLAGVGLARV